MTIVRAWAIRLGRHLRGSRHPAGGDVPNVVVDGPGTTPSAGSYDDWTGRFIAFADHVGVIARTSTRPAVVEVGRNLERFCSDSSESLDEMQAWRPLPRRWPVWPESAIGIDGTLKMFEMLEKLLSTLIHESGSSRDPLESAWNQATFKLRNELGQLKDEYIAHVRR